MRKTFCLFSFSTLFFAYLVSCRDVLKNELKIDELEQKITVKTTTNLISDALIKGGIAKIDVQIGNDYTIYKLLKIEGVNITEGSLDLSKFYFTLKNGKLSCSGNPNLSVSLDNNEVIIQTKDFVGSLDKYLLQNNFILKELPVLLLMLREITLPEIEKINTLTAQFKKSRIAGGCSWWNTYVAFSVNVSREMAMNELREAGPLVHWGKICRVTTEMESSCYTDSHLCIATQTYCCE